MILVVDANIVISALLGSRRVARVFARSDLTLLAPRILWEEVAKHRTLVCARAQITMTEFDTALLKLTFLITAVGVSSYSSLLTRARSALGRAMVDEHYLACALAIKADALWTHDSDFRSQQLIKVISTQELGDFQ